MSISLIMKRDFPKKQTNENMIPFIVNDPEGELFLMRSDAQAYIDMDEDGYYIVPEAYWEYLVDIMKGQGYEPLMDEASTTGGVEGYLTPYAFGKIPDDRIEMMGFKKVPKTKKYFKPMESTYKKMMRQLNEISYRDYKKDDTATNEQKINKSINQINKLLGEVETILDRNYKLKNETGFKSNSYWKRSKKNFSKISERLIRISNKMKELGQ